MLIPLYNFYGLLCFSTAFFPAPIINSLATATPLAVASMPQLRNHRRSLGSNKLHRQTLVISSKYKEDSNSTKKETNEITRRQRPLTCYQDNKLTSNLNTLQAQKSSSKIIDFFKGVAQKKQYDFKNADLSEFYMKNKENIEQNFCGFFICCAFLI